VADSCAADGLVQWHSLHACSPHYLAPSCCQLATCSVRCAPVLQLYLPFCCSLSSNINVKDPALCTMHNVVCHVLQLMLSSKLHGSAAIFVCIILFLSSFTDAAILYYAQFRLSYLAALACERIVQCHLTDHGAYFLQKALALKYNADKQWPRAVYKHAVYCVQAWLSRQLASFPPWYASVPTPTPLTSSTPQTPPPGSSTSHRGPSKSGIKPHLQSCLPYPDLFSHQKHLSKGHQQKQQQQQMMSLVPLVFMLGTDFGACPSPECLKGLEEGW